MCKRAVKLQAYINQQLEKEITLKISTLSTSTSSNTAEADYKDLKKLQLAATKQQHLKAITQILEHFKEATNYLSKNQEPQI